MTDTIRSCTNTNNDDSFHSCSGGTIPTATSSTIAQDTQQQLRRSISRRSSSISSADHHSEGERVLSVGSQTNTSHIRELLAVNEANREQSKNRDGSMLICALAFTPIALISGLLCTFRLCNIVKIVLLDDPHDDDNQLIDLEREIGFFTWKNGHGTSSCVRYSDEDQELLFDEFFIAARLVASITSVTMGVLLVFFWCTCCGICCFQRIRQYYICMGVMLLAWAIVNCFSLLLLMKSDVCDHINKRVFLKEEVTTDLTLFEVGDTGDGELEVESCSLAWAAWVPIVISAIYCSIAVVFLWIGFSRPYVQSLVEQQEILGALLILHEMNNRLADGEAIPFDLTQLFMMLQNPETFEAISTLMDTENNRAEEELQVVASSLSECEENTFAAAAA